MCEKSFIPDPDPAGVPSNSTLYPRTKAGACGVSPSCMSFCWQLRRRRIDWWSKMAPTPHTTTPRVTPMPIPALAALPRPGDVVGDAEPGTVGEVGVDVGEAATLGAMLMPTNFPPWLRLDDTIDAAELGTEGALEFDGAATLGWMFVPMALAPWLTLDGFIDGVK